MCRQSSYNSPRIVAAAVAAHRAFFIVEENTLNVRQADVYSRALALQLPFPKISESMGNHDSKIVDAGSVD